MTLKHIIPVLFFIAVTVSCEEKEQEIPETLWVSIGSTQCADPWDGLEMGSTEHNVTEYLEQNNIVVYGFKTDYIASEAFVCAACICPSGIVISVRIARYDLNAAIALGFQQPN